MKRLKQSFITWFVVAMLCLLLGFLLGKFKLGIVEDSLALMEVDLQAIKIEKSELSKKMAGIEASLITDRQTIKSLTKDNDKLNEQLNALANKLYFYERVVAPESQSSGVQVYSFVVDKNSGAGKWNYELVLMQAQKGRRLLKGSLELNFSVVENEHFKNVSITKLSDSFSPTFKFKYFQTVKGVFTLPEKMLIDEIILKINVPGNRWHKKQRIEQYYDWQTLIKKGNGDLAEDTDKLPNVKADNLTEN